MTKLIFPMLPNQKNFSADNHMYQEAVDFENLLVSNQIPIEFFGSIYTQETDNNDSKGDQVVRWRELVDILQKEDGQIIYLELNYN